ncbi:uncharacterized protein N7482_004956 [Penicillium canariense]|uniref:Galactose oxidase-like Early set domain-containing protein n=1 Tax=Penicillium canariense TaxID=189055 RepID=A0A9W9I3U8_9EURO|nr:uncharacterized protein N7482_004956 [Penicillium canariense]KAJ5166175.1 hypothetical protein N7482_004956 [Penicillium canariense]
MFCPGIAIDGTGIMVVTSGNDASETSLYDANEDEWIKGLKIYLCRGKAINWYYVEGEGSFEGARKRLEDEDSISANAIMFEGKATSNACIITPGSKARRVAYWLGGTTYSERVFHTSVILLDRRVFVAGSQTFGIAFNEENVFTPPYPLTEKGELRSSPDITSRLPASASLVRIGSATHTVNTDQRRISLNLWRVPVLGRHYATIPNDPGLVIPGFWMLFVMDEAGSPSIAKMILITSNLKTIGTSDEKQCEHGFLSEYLPSWKPALAAQIPRRG